MDRIEIAGEAETPQLDRLRSVLEAAPVCLAILFGSRATGHSHESSDIDLAVEFEELRPGDPDYNDTFFGLSAEACDVLGTDDVDLVDVHSVSPSLARSIFDEGLLLYGDDERVETLRRQVLSDTSAERSPGDRFDEALERIDEHLA